MKLVYFYHTHNLHKLAKHPDFYNFELAIWLHTLARSLISVFVPVLLYTTGYSITTILIFYLLYNLIDVPMNFGADRIIRKIGARKVMIIGTIISILFFGLLGILPPGNWPMLIVLANLAAIYDTFFWIAHIYLFTEASKVGFDAGRSVGLLESIRKFANVVGPIVGAIILIFFGKTLLSFASIFFFILSIIPLYKMHHIVDIPLGKKPSFSNFFSKPQEKRDYIAMMLWGIHDEVDSILWPLFIFIVIGTIGSVAAIPVIVALCAAIFSYIAGRLTKNYGTKLIIVGCIILASSWILRLTIDNNFSYFITVVIVGIFSLFSVVPIYASIISRGAKINSLSAATYRNAASMVLHVPLYIILIVIIELFKVSFAVASMSLFILVFITLIFDFKFNKSYTS